MWQHKRVLALILEITTPEQVLIMNHVASFLFFRATPSMCVISHGGVCLLLREPVNKFPLLFNICPSLWVCFERTMAPGKKDKPLRKHSGEINGEIV